MSETDNTRGVPLPKAPRITQPPPPPQQATSRAGHSRQYPRAYLGVINNGLDTFQPPVDAVPDGGTAGTSVPSANQEPSPEKIYAPYISNPNEMVTFFIGSDKQEFKMHKDFAVKHSPVLRAAFGSQFEEGKDGTYMLEDIRVDVFRLFWEYSYTEKVSVKYRTKASHDPAFEGHEGGCGQQDLDLVELWILGDRLIISCLQNHVMQHLKRSFDFCSAMTPSAFKIIYQGTKGPCPLRRLAVCECAWGVENSHFQDWAEHIPHEMLMDMVAIFKTACPDHTNWKNKRAILEEKLDFGPKDES